MKIDRKNENLKNAIISAKKGEKQGFLMLYNLYHLKLYRYCLYLTKERGLAEDLTQETFFKVFKTIENLQSEHAFNSWIHSIALRRFLDYKKVKRNSFLTNYSEVPDTGATSNSVEMLNVVNRALESLSEEEKNTLLLVDLAENSHEEAAGILKLDVGTIKNRLRSARKNFASYCENHKVEITGIFSLPVKKTS